MIDVVKIIISKHTPEKKQQRSNKEEAKKQQRRSKEAAKKKQRRSKEAKKQRSKEAKHNDIIRFVPFHHPTHHLHWTYDSLDNVVLL